MADLISRQAAIKAIEDLRDCYNGFSDTYDKACIIGALEEVPSVQQKQRWIPVTERLPEQGKRYLVIRFDEVTKTQFIDILWHDAHDLWWNRLYKGNYNVTHWMPLPEPPMEVDDGDS